MLYPRYQQQVNLFRFAAKSKKWRSQIFFGVNDKTLHESIEELSQKYEK